MKIALTGGTGFIGSNLAEALSSGGHELTCLVRPTSDLRWLRGLGVRVVTGELDDPDSLGDFIRDADAVVHTSGAKFAPSLAQFVRGNLGQTRNLYEAADRTRSRPQRFLYISSISAAGPSPGPTALTEDVAPHPITPYGVSKNRAEEYIRSRGDDTPFTIIRPPVVYGPRDKDLLLYFQLVQRHLRLIMGRSQRFDMVYVRNLALGIRLALENDRARNQTYFLADEAPYTWESFTGHVREAVGAFAVSIRPPLSLTLLAANLAARVARATGVPFKLERNKVREFAQPYWLISSQKARDHLRYEPPYDAPRTIRETVEWYRSQGWLH